MKTRVSIAFLVVTAAAVQSAFAQGEDIYAVRRERLIQALGNNVALFASGTSPQRPSKNFLYLTGLSDTGMTLVLCPSGPIREALFTPKGEWVHAEVCSTARVHAPSELNRRLVEYSAGYDSAFIVFGEFEVLTRIRRVAIRFSTLKKINPLLAEMRAIKDDEEIGCLRKACSITAEALNDVFRAAEPGLREKDLEMIIHYGITRRYSPGETFLQAASGPNATNIHFGATERVLGAGDLIVFDVGAQWEGYTSDISRTIPADGHFTREQREIYELVLRAQETGIQLIIPGKPMRGAQRAAEDVIMEGLSRLGLVTDIQCSWQKAFYVQHGFGHFVGLDVHDVWDDYRVDSLSLFKPGMVMTFEPGLYFPPAMIDSLPARLRSTVDMAEFRRFAEEVRPVYQNYAGIGVRIEDDILVTERGNEVLTAGVPKTPAAIESLMREKSPHNAFDQPGSSGRQR